MSRAQREAKVLYIPSIFETPKSIDAVRLTLEACAEAKGMARAYTPNRLLETEAVERAANVSDIETLLPRDLAETLVRGNRAARVWSALPALWAELLDEPGWQLVALLGSVRRTVAGASFLLREIECAPKEQDISTPDGAQASKPNDKKKQPNPLTIDRWSFEEEGPYRVGACLGAMRSVGAEAIVPEAVDDGQLAEKVRSSLNEAVGGEDFLSLVALVVPGACLADVREMQPSQPVLPEDWLDTVRSLSSKIGPDALRVYRRTAQDYWRGPRPGQRSWSKPYRVSADSLPVAAPSDPVRRRGPAAIDDDFASDSDLRQPMTRLLLSSAARAVVAEETWRGADNGWLQGAIQKMVNGLRRRELQTADRYYRRVSIPLKLWHAVASSKAHAEAARTALREIHAARYRDDTCGEAELHRWIAPHLASMEGSPLGRLALRLALHRAELDLAEVSTTVSYMRPHVPRDEQVIPEVFFEAFRVEARTKLERARSTIGRVASQARPKSTTRRRAEILREVALSVVIDDNRTLRADAITHLHAAFDRAGPTGPRGKRLIEAQVALAQTTVDYQHMKAELLQLLAAVENPFAPWAQTLVRVMFAVDLPLLTGRPPNNSFLDRLVRHWTAVAFGTNDIFVRVEQEVRLAALMRQGATRMTLAQQLKARQRVQAVVQAGVRGELGGSFRRTA